jgi:hypothetical protein
MSKITFAAAAIAGAALLGVSSVGGAQCIKHDHACEISREAHHPEMPPKPFSPTPQSGKVVMAATTSLSDIVHFQWAFAKSS